MKRLAYIFFLSALSSILLICSSCSRKQGSASTLQSALDTYTMSSVIDILGYDPCITVYSDTDSSTCDDTTDCTLYVHGWGESQKSIPFFKRNSNLLPKTVIGFDFQDAHSGTYMPDLKKTNFCQTNDIASLLMMLKVLDECNVPVFHLFGSSRGGGTVITTIARLMKYKKYKPFFNRLGITPDQSDRILEKIKAGTIVLNCPLVDVEAAINNKLVPFGAGWLSPFVTSCIIPCITNYSPRKDNPLKSAAYVQKLDLPILIHFQKNDLILGNDIEAPFYKAIMGKNSYLVLGNDGGHIHKGETLSPALHAFRKKYNAPYNDNQLLLQKGEHLLADAQPCFGNIEHYISSVYKQSPFIFKPQKDIKWQHAFDGYDTTTMVNTLGYDPVMRIYQSDALVQNNSTTVYVHGYGDNYKFTVPLFQLNSYLLPGTIVSFNFQDVTEGAFKVKLDKSSVGQAADIAALASILKVLDECGLEAIHLFGYSRGGATTVTTLARLCTYDRHEQFFQDLGITKDQSQRILNKVRAGTIILNCPLVDSRSVAQYWFGSLGNIVMDTIIPKIMEHNPNEDQALHAAKLIQDMHFKILVHFQKNDTILGNTLIDAEFYNNLKGPHTYLVIADEGGHLHAGKTLGKAIQAFRKKYNGAYYPIPSALTKGDALLKKSPLTECAVKNYVAREYA